MICHSKWWIIGLSYFLTRIKVTPTTAAQTTASNTVKLDVNACNKITPWSLEDAFFTLFKSVNFK